MRKRFPVIAFLFFAVALLSTSCTGILFDAIKNNESSAQTVPFSQYAEVNASGVVVSIDKNKVPEIVVIPSIVNGITITRIGEDAFFNCQNIKKVSLPNTIESLGTDCFACCYSLESINIPNSVTTIGESAFYSCTKIGKLSIPESVSSIGRTAFWNWTEDQSIDVYYGGFKSGGLTFASIWTGCGARVRVSVPYGTTVIPSQAFLGCGTLESISLPDTLTSIGSEAFYCCGNIRAITIPDSVKTIGADAFYGVDSVTTIIVPEGVTILNEYSFAMKSLATITLPKSLTSINDKAFGGYYTDNCANLENIYYNGTKNEWAKITKGSGWNSQVPATVVHCTDGDVIIK